MNREILFRGKPIDKQFGEWVPGYYLKDLDNREVKHYIFNCPLKIEVDPETVGQFTGHSDKDGKEIYEGDVLKHPDNDLSQWKGIVRFEDGSFKITPNGGDYVLNAYRADRVKVIGNIYDNPEILS